MTKTKMAETATQEDAEQEEYQLWLEENELNSMIDLEDVPAFNEPFAKLIKTITKCTDEFMEVIRVEGHIFSYEKFVATMGGEPSFIFSVFGGTCVQKHRIAFLNSWMFASYLRARPMINDAEEGIFDMERFNKIEWIEYFRLKRRDLQMKFMNDFGDRKGYEENMRKQYATSTTPTSKANPKSKSTGAEPPEARPSDVSKASKDTQSPIKETQIKKEKDFDEEPPPPSSKDDDDSDDSDEDHSVPSLVLPRKLYESSDVSDDSGEDEKQQKRSKKYRKKKKKEKVTRTPKSKSKKSGKPKETSKETKTKQKKKKKDSSSRKKAKEVSSDNSTIKDDDADEDGDDVDDEEDNSSGPPDDSSGDDSSDSNPKAAFMRGIRRREKEQNHETRKQWTKKDHRLTKRPVIPSTIKWDNRRASFPELKNCLQAHIIQAGMNYMIKPLFVRRYKKYGPQALNYYKGVLDISKAQFQHDLDVLYGYMKSVFRTGMAKKHLKAYEATCDGIRVYDAIDSEYGLGGDKSVLIQHYETVINQKYHRDYPDGITGFVDKLEDAFAELESLEEKYSDRKKSQFLTRNLLVVGYTDWMVGYCESRFAGRKNSFSRSCQWLRSKDAQSMYASSHKASAKARMVTSMDPDEEVARDIEYFINYANQQQGPRFANRGPMAVPFLLWKLLDASTQKAIRDARQANNEPYRGNRGGMNQNVPKDSTVSFSKDSMVSLPKDTATSETKEGAIPRQYERAANKMGKEEDEGTKTPTEDPPNEMNDFDEWTRFMNNVKGFTVDELNEKLGIREVKMARTETEDDVDVRAHTEFYEVIARLVKGNNVHISTSDNGADTCVVGTGWKVIATTTRKANLVGFDSNYARKKGLPIVTADTVVRLQDSSEAIIRAHETVYNEGSPTTLISEFQVRTKGLVLDSVHKDHTASIDGRKGTQSFFLTEDKMIPLIMKGGLMTFEHHEPSEEDYEKLEVYEITESQRWIPRKFYDDSEAMAPLSETIITGFNTTSNMGKEGNDDSGEIGKILPSTQEDDDELDEFYEARMDDEDHFWYTSDTFSTKVLKLTVSEDNLRYFDPSDDMSEKARFGKAFHLTIDYDAFETPRDEGHLFIRDTSVDKALQELTLEEIYGYIPTQENFDTFAFAVRAVHRLRDEDLEKLQPNFAFRPLEVIRQTLQHTTQLAKAIVNAPMTRHLASRFKWMSRFRLHETVCTDTIFSNCQDVLGRTCAQVYWGTQSHMMNVLGMRSKSEMPLSYQDFMREEGIPSCLHSDGAAEQTGQKVKSLNREYLVKESYSEPYHPWQNPAETRSIKWLKRTSRLLMDRVGAPEFVWLHAMIYLALVNNWTSDELLGWKTPFEKRHGYTPDISALLSFHFFEKVYYLECDETFPNTNEKPGYIIGIAMNIGDALTFDILTDDKETVIARSVVRSVKPRSLVNTRVLFDPNLDPEIQTHQENQNLELPVDFQLSSSKLPIAQKKKRRYRLKTKKLQESIDKISETANSKKDLADSGGAQATKEVIHSGKSKSKKSKSKLPKSKSKSKSNSKSSKSKPRDRSKAVTDSGETQETQDIPIVSDAEESESSDSGESTSESDSVSNSDSDFEAEEKVRTSGTPGIPTRRSTRQRKPASTVSLMVTVALAMMAGSSHVFANTASIDSLKPITELPETHVPLEQDFGSSFFKEPEMRKLRELQLLDQMSGEDEDIDWDIVEVIKHQSARVIRRIPKQYLEKATVCDKHVRLCVRFRNGETQWTQMNAVKLQDPFPIIQYVKRNNLEKSPSFEWVEKIVKDEDRLTQLARAYKAKVDNGPKYKFGVEVPRSPRHGLELDRVGGNKLWKQATETELKQINEYKTFREPTEEDDLSKFQLIPYHMIYDVKFDGRRKARLVAGGNWTVTPKEDIYSGVIGMDSVRLAFALASMHNLDVCAADVGNAFLYGKTKEKVMIRAGPEFGESAGKILIIDKGLYGLKSSAARFHEHLAAKLRKMGFLPSKADHDLWYRKVDDYYEYIATYVDDLLAFSKDPMKLIEIIKTDYVLKGVGVPEYYLGGNVDEVTDKDLLEKGIRTILSAKTYIRNALGKLENLFDGGPFKKCATPMMESYHPECDDSPLLDDVNHTKYRAMIGSANWVITLGRLDITYATNTMARYSMAPREGHLIALKRLFGYLRKHPDGQILVDPNPFDHTEALKKYTAYDNWKEFYPDAVEAMPPNQPVPGIRKAQITIYVDADHAHDVVTRRSVTGIILFINGTPVRWVSKRQKTVETSTYGSELVAARIAVELAMEYRYSLRMLGVELDGPCMMFGDNNSVILNTTIPSSMLKKKHNAIAYHRVRECVAAEIVRFVHVDSISNLADVLTKPLGAVAFWRVVKPILFKSVIWKDADTVLEDQGNTNAVETHEKSF
jgi:hypothetical protein